MRTKKHKINKEKILKIVQGCLGNKTSWLKRKILVNL